MIGKGHNIATWTSVEFDEFLHMPMTMKSSPGSRIRTSSDPFSFERHSSFYVMSDQE